MTRAVQRRSELYASPVGQSVAPELVSESDLLIDAAKYNYEGNFAVACFDDDRFLGARFGFGKGAVDLSDFGVAHTPDKSFVALHIELLTREGAALWLASGQYAADQIAVASDRIDMKLPGVFEIAGYPQMHWRFNSADNDLEIDAQLSVRNLTVLPDSLTQHNLLAMWASVCDIRAKVRLGDDAGEVWGVAFHDRPRVLLRQNPVPTFGYRLYTPIRFDDGSTLIAFYTQDVRKNPVVNACFGVFHDAQGGAHFLPLARVLDLKLDLDRKPATWEQHLEGEGVVIDLSGRVQPLPIARAWGVLNVPQTRKAIANLPMLFNVSGTIRQGGQSRRVRGEGLAEYVTRSA